MRTVKRYFMVFFTVIKPQFFQWPILLIVQITPVTYTVSAVIEHHSRLERYND